ncbi:phage major capsid protein [Dietzia cinnamea]|uniref:phage major capsid protein n=1 Tax=Dietzia cinnamea TaxID=321318 RepID=UPI0021A2D1C8|nr:phage major capsid protein [Dietzia cinnamea]MCT1884983.1 phage major capsid protein [Dietzia cinnamea]
MNIKQEREALIKSSMELIEKVEKRGNGFTPAERSELERNEKRLGEIKEQQERADEDAALLAQFKGSSLDPSGSHSAGSLAVGPAQIKSVARELSSRLVTEVDGQKALIAGGTATATVIARDVAAQPQLPTSLLETIAVVGLDSPTYRYLRQTSRAMNADVVAPGAEKPTSSVGLTPVEDHLRVVAHLSEGIAKYDLLDTRNLQTFVQAELHWGLMTKVEQLVLSGDGQGENPAGILAQSGIQTQEFSGDILTTIRKAITATESLGYLPNVIALSPADWEAVELSRTSGSGEFVLDASPVDRAARRLYGIQVVVTTALEPGTAVVGDFREVTLFTDRRGVMAEWNGQAQDDFARNLIRLRTEGRFGVGVGQPQAIVRVDTAA